MIWGSILGVFDLRRMTRIVGHQNHAPFPSPETPRAKSKGGCRAEDRSFSSARSCGPLRFWLKWCFLDKQKRVLLDKKRSKLIWRRNVGDEWAAGSKGRDTPWPHFGLLICLFHCFNPFKNLVHLGHPGTREAKPFIFTALDLRMPSGRILHGHAGFPENRIWQISYPPISHPGDPYPWTNLWEPKS